jgi:hypothetical protein
VGILGASIPIITVIVGWSIRKKHRKYLNRYMKTVNTTYRTYYNDKQECLRHLHEIKNDIMSVYVRGQLNESDYNMLKDTISDCEGRLDTEQRD